MSNDIKLNTEPLPLEDNEVFWPNDVPNDAYTLVYTHSELQLNQNQPKLPAHLLYEAWAFDGEKSWHIWQRNETWVCTTYDAKVTDKNKDEIIEHEQLLMDQFKTSTKKDLLIIHHRIAYDDDGQAYIAYSCPINLA